ncbi:MAG TPA: hypothetical protein VFP80_04910 [Thermoanaerobaculia bacterium]|nr:hypothetical protein [Thermoanaerobaculia bacterium]
MLAIFRRKFTSGAKRIVFTLEEIRDELRTLGLEARNAADVIYRMKSRTILPEEIRQAGYNILEITSRGTYAFVIGIATLVEYPPEVEITEVQDRTPKAVRSLLHPDFGFIDEQGLLSVCRYNDLLSRFLEATTFHVKSHIRKSVPGVGQAEVDDLHVEVHGSVHEPLGLTIVPIEAKAKDDPVNRVQVIIQTKFAKHAFPDHPCRPVTIKLFEDGRILFMEFNVTDDANALEVVRHRYFRVVEQR